VDVLGTTFSNFGLIDTLGSQDSLGGASDAFLARFTSDGNLVWSTYIGGDSLVAVLNYLLISARIFMCLERLSQQIQLHLAMLISQH
jgi:hypothetical protein